MGGIIFYKLSFLTLNIYVCECFKTLGRSKYNAGNKTAQATLGLINIFSMHQQGWQYFFGDDSWEIYPPFQHTSVKHVIIEV